MRQPDVTEAELAVLEVLWERGPCTRRQVAEVLYAANPQSQYTTVQKLLARLETKGHVKQNREGEALQFRAAIARDELISQRLIALAERLCDGSITPLFMNLVRAKPLKPREVDALRRYLDELKKSSKTRVPRE